VGKNLRQRLTRPDADDPEEANTGLQTLSAVRLERIFERTLRRRRPVMVHAIGDRDVRNRVEHVQIVDPAIIPRFKAADLIASFQPNFLYENEMTRHRVGQARRERCYSHRDFWDAGVPVILSSDWAFGRGRFPHGCHLGDRGVDDGRRRADRLCRLRQRYGATDRATLCRTKILLRFGRHIWYNGIQAI